MSCSLAPSDQPIYPIVVIQIPDTHWSLMIITDEDTGRGMCCQAAFHRGSVSEWESTITLESIGVPSTITCVGGVQVGTVKAGDLERVRSILAQYRIEPELLNDGTIHGSYVCDLINLLKEGVIREDLRNKDVTMGHLRADLVQSKYMTSEAAEKGSVTPCICWKSNP
ncbi:hypothetical protein A0H81_14434 [Grifola frondosa]|uniref:Uncharacterized protein n=1 Tax=Grifola frondosa TaxID=5627 RepID=A0A1C7LNM6_GRIFR|nr:hypothetical protein A0H81_14434 [Grifola frondosa]